MVMDKKGFIIELFAFMVIGILVILFFGILIYGFTRMNTILTSGNLDNSAINMTKFSGQTIGKLSTGMGNLRLVALIMIFAYSLATLLVAYFSSKHPIWLFVYILITILMVIFSIYISNSYETLMNNSQINSMVTGFGMSGIIVLYLPYWVGGIGLVGTILSIIGVVMSRRILEDG